VTGWEGTMRRVLYLLLYLGIGMAGSIMMAGFLMHGGHGVIFAGGALLAALGAYLLWTDRHWLWERDGVETW
jgi:hypothetical protein